jgi:hypothetical protein
MEPLRMLCLAGVVLLSLILPLYAAAARDRTGARLRYTAVWSGQICLAAAGLLIVAAPALSGFGLVLGVVSCVVWGRVFHDQARFASSPSQTA